MVLARHCCDVVMSPFFCFLLYNPLHLLSWSFILYDTCTTSFIVFIVQAYFNAAARALCSLVLRLRGSGNEPRMYCACAALAPHVTSRIHARRVATTTWYSCVLSGVHEVRAS